ncbi:LuxR C-terminal-related transcriptional regulator [Flavobacterium psychrotrophum]|uniref:LuxR C-terminal-related transcriptional regulator n=1 Tax=Flavobacterium psychrotrophum TaxID=2294119 RepID=UPI000E323649|nr:LuxR C-terminal-related transcriptional regulator [Flavobacterium psychrotrophum]
MKALKEVKKIWETIAKGENVLDENFDLGFQRKLLDVFHAGSFFFYVVNVRKSMLEYVSPEIKEVIGYEADVTLEDIVSFIHPEDVPYFVSFEAAVRNFFGELSGNSLFSYKVQYDLRFKKSDGSYIRILHQFVIIQHDAEDIKTFAVDTDIDHLKTSGKPQLSFIGLDGSPSYLNVDTEKDLAAEKGFFTKRERQILQALAAGMSSQEISEMLSISKYTVDVHRKNMLKKSEAKSTYEILQKAFNMGWV